MDPSDFDIHWADINSDVAELANFFIDNVSLTYISHGEIQSGRARNLENWNPDLREKLVEEFIEKSFGPPSAAQPNSIAVGGINDRIAALSIVGCQFKVSSPFAILEDLVVEKSLRGSNLGSLFVRWIELEMQNLKIEHLFLESGIHNTSAHNFFRQRGFQSCSTVMIKTLILPP